MLTPAEAEAAIAAAIAPVSHEPVPLAGLRRPRTPRGAPGRARCAPVRSRGDGRHRIRARRRGPPAVPHRRRPGRRRTRARPRLRSRLFRGHDGRGDAARLRHGRARRAGRDGRWPRRTARGLRTGTLAPRASTGCRRAGGRRPPACRHAARGARARDRRIGRPRRNSRFPARRASRSSRPATNSSSRASRSSTTRSGARTPTASPPRFRSRAFAPSANLQLPDRKDAIASALAVALERARRAGALRRRLGGAIRLRARACSHRSACARPSTASRSGRAGPCGSARARAARRCSPCPATRCPCSCASRDMSSRRSAGWWAMPARAPPQVALARDFTFEKRLTCFLPVTLGYDQQGRTLAEPRPTGGSGDFIALAGTDGFVELPPGPATHAAGLAVPFYRW